MAVDFPNSPSLNDEFTVGDKTWTWNGTGWYKNAPTGGGTMTDTGAIMTWPTWLPHGSPSSSVANAVGEGIGFVFQAPYTGTIDRVGFFIATTTTGGVVDYRVETVTTAGLNSGTLWGTNTNVSVTVDNADDNVWKEGILTAGASVTKGDLLAVMFVVPSGYNGGINTSNLRSTTFNPGFPYGLLNSTGSWAIDDAYPLFTIRYSDGVYRSPVGCYPFSSGNSISISSSTSPDEVGAKVTMPFTARLVGVSFFVDSLAATDDFSLIVYDDANTVLTSRAVEAGAIQNSRDSLIQFPDSVTLTKDSVYRITIRPDTTNGFTTPYSDIASTTLAPLTPGQGASIWTQRTDAGAWTDVNTRFSWIKLLIDGVLS